MVEPCDDGITHINIYSNASTKLGRMLSNFYKFPINTVDGPFLSVEAYWYYLSIEDCKDKEQLRKCYGFWAKKTGIELLKCHSKRFDEDFEHKILLAIWYKFCRNFELITPKYKDLPFYHYYNYYGNVLDVTNKYKWMVDGITEMRDRLINNK